MIAVIFEVVPNAENKQEYLDIASELKPYLSNIDGFISIERFSSLQDPNKILSLSYWKDEEAVAEWRNLESHRDAQSKGRNYIFKNYSLKVANVIRAYGMHDRDELPDDSRLSHGN